MRRCLEVVQWFSKGKGGSEQQLREALFRRDSSRLLQIQGEAQKQGWFTKYRPLFSLGRDTQQNEKTIEQIGGEDTLMLSCTLEWLAWMTHAHQAYPVSLEPYIRLYHKYCASLNLTTEPLGSTPTLTNPSLRLNPTLSTCHLFPSGHLYLDHPPFLAHLKLTKISLLRLLSSTRSPSFHQVTSLISPQLYNITDTPLIASLLREYFYPSLEDSLSQAMTALQYGRHFGVFPHTMLHSIYSIVEGVVGGKQEMEVEEWLAVTHLLHKVWIYHNVQLQEAQLVGQFKQMFKRVMGKFIRMEGEKYSVKEITTNSNVLVKLVKKVQQNLREQHIKGDPQISSKPSSFLTQMTEKEEGSSVLQGAYQTTLTLGVNLFILVGVYSGGLPYSCLLSLLSSPYHYKFLSDHTTLSSFLYTYIITMDKCRHDPLFQLYLPSTSSTQALLTTTQQRINSFISQQLTSYTQQLLGQPQQLVRWRQDRWKPYLLPSPSNLPNSKEEMSEMGVMRLLQQHPAFMLQQMGRARGRALEELGPVGTEVGVWNYPYHYDYLVHQQQQPHIRGSISSPLTRNKVHQPNTVKFTLRQISSVNSINRLGPTHKKKVIP